MSYYEGEKKSVKEQKKVGEEVDGLKKTFVIKWMETEEEEQ